MLCFLGRYWPDEAVGVLVGPAFPRVVGRREVEPGVGRAFDGGVAMELRPVVRRNHPDRAGLAPNQLCRARVHLHRRARPQLAEHDVYSPQFLWTLIWD